MRDIVLLCPNNSICSGLKNALSQNGMYAAFTALSAPEALRIASTQVSAGILICCGISVSNVSKLIQMLPTDWDIAVILSSGQIPPMITSNITYFNIPLDRQQFISTMIELSSSSVCSFGGASSYSGSRTPQEKEIIDKAKKIIMNQRSCSESDAYKYIRTKSMNSGVKLIETAKQICRDNPGKE